MTASDARPQIHQFVPVLEQGDAIGNHVIAVRELLQRKGYRSEIFAWRSGRSMRKHCHKYTDYPQWSSPCNIMVYHFGVSSPITNFFLKAPDRKVIIYHNITPEHFFKGVNDKIYYILKKGRQELASISGKVDLAIADSEYNHRELAELGFENITTVPLLLDFKNYEVAPGRSVMDMYNDGKVNIIFVGRISPNKKQEDVIRAFSIYRKYINEKSRLFIIGQNHQVPEYDIILNRLVSALGVEDVHLTGGVSQAELNAYYRLADLFLSMSEHEGFCIPLVECMHFEVPVLAYESSAVPGTLDGSGVLFSKKDYSRVAEMMDLIVSDENIKERIIRGQKERLRHFQIDRIEKEIDNSLTSLLS